MASNILSLPKRNKARPPQGAPPLQGRPVPPPRAPTVGLGGVILVLLYLSLSHLAHGIVIVIVTGSDPWEGTAMAIGLDLLIVALECAMVATVVGKAHRGVGEPGDRRRLRVER
jgi:hypothetical protein